MVRSILAVAFVITLGVSCSDTSTETKSSPTGAGGTTVTATERDFSITIGSATAPAGPITFSITNKGPGVHMFVVLKTELAADKLPVEAGPSVNETGPGVTKVTDKTDIAAGATETLTTTLAAGRYVLICNLAGHYNNGMRASMTVV